MGSLVKSRVAAAALLAVLLLSTPLFAANTYARVDLVSDTGNALLTGSNLINAWGVALSPSGGAFWVSNNGTGTSTLYNGDVAGSPFAKVALTVAVPPNPTGVVYNGTITRKYAVTNLRGLLLSRRG